MFARHNFPCPALLDQQHANSTLHFPSALAELVATVVDVGGDTAATVVATVVDVGGDTAATVVDTHTDTLTRLNTHSHIDTCIDAHFLFHVVVNSPRTASHIVQPNQNDNKQLPSNRCHASSKRCPPSD